VLMSLLLRALPRAERYVLLERLGRGGAAEAWRARREGGLLVEEVCVKRPLFSLSGEQRRALVEEARLLSRVRHANVVSLLDALEDDSGGIFLVLELVRGVDLRALSRALCARGERTSPALVAAIGVALCRALAAAQRSLPAGLVHRDVTPHNVLLSAEGEIKLADFGIARALDRERWTRAGVVKGKTAYVSPEQLRGEELDVRSDLFSVGVLLYELLTGQRPFGDGSQISTLHAIATGARLPLARAAPHAPARLTRVVEQFLAPECSRRPPSADLAGRLLAPCAGDQLAIDELRRLVRSARGPGLVSGRPARAGALELDRR